MNLLKMILISIETAYHLKRIYIYVYIYIYILSEWAYEFDGIEYQINSNKLIYNIKTEGCSLKDFRGYRNPLQFFIISGW